MSSLCKKVTGPSPAGRRRPLGRQMLRAKLLLQFADAVEGYTEWKKIYCFA